MTVNKHNKGFRHRNFESFQFLKSFAHSFPKMAANTARASGAGRWRSPSRCGGRRRPRGAGDFPAVRSLTAGKSAADVREDDVFENAYLPPALPVFRVRSSTTLQFWPLRGVAARLAEKTRQVLLSCAGLPPSPP